jgi:hypothetical protein
LDSGWKIIFDAARSILSPEISDPEKAAKEIWKRD